jgi:hypothetical protein
MHQKIHKLPKPFPHLIVKNMYNEEELELIWEELNFLTKPHKFIINDLGTDEDSQGKSKSESKSIVLDYIYAEKSISNILVINRKLFDGGYLNIFSQISPSCKSILYQNFDITKIRYYEDGIQYLPHVDIFNYTAITFFHKNPKTFIGGELYFPEYDYTFECNNNSMIIFPSCLLHASKTVSMKKTQDCLGFGKYSMMQFLKLV